MAEYTVIIDNEECNTTAGLCSLTGRVNGTQCAALVKLAQVNPLDLRNAKLVKQRALIKSFQIKLTQSTPDGEVVTA